MVVCRVAGRLDDEYIFAAYVFLDFYEDFLVGKPPDLAFGERGIQVFGYFLSQGSVGIARDDLHEPQVLLVRRRFCRQVVPCKHAERPRS